MLKLTVLIYKDCKKLYCFLLKCIELFAFLLALFIKVYVTSVSCSLHIKSEDNKAKGHVFIYKVINAHISTANSFKELKYAEVHSELVGWRLVETFSRNAYARQPWRVMTYCSKSLFFNNLHVESVTLKVSTAVL